jgi:predicted O-linked N-acetylglucosamine transferase (SPINDLY family)
MLAVHPEHAGAWFMLGNALCGLKRYRRGIASYEAALALLPDNTSAWRKRAAALAALGRKAALPDAARAPKDAQAWALRAGFFAASSRYAEAVTASDRALSIDPQNPGAARIGIHSRLFACDWSRREEDRQRVAAGLKAGVRLLSSIDFRRICDSEEQNLLAAELWAKAYAVPEKPAWHGNRHSHDRIRIAYMSTDFRDHVVGDVLAGVFEHHDRNRFETMAISLGPDDASRMRRRLQAAFEHFIDAQDMSDADLAHLMREKEIDIAIDLNGHAGAHRAGILALRPVPVQVNYLGYPGTMGASFIDYIVADRTVIPEENRRFYTEQVVYLPHSYMPNDGQRGIAKETPSRVQAGLPEKGFVFACHNDERKIGPEIFDIWMRLLQKVAGSVLWLKSLNASAVGNLRREAKDRGVAPERLVFAPRAPRTEDHLARLRLADLFLDTLPYNAHATACDALWAGLPVLTCRGKAFPGLVGASVLQAIGLPELVASSLTDYEELALALARDPERLAAIKAKLMRNRVTEPLFDTARFTRDLESAYTTMWERHQSGLPPASFAAGG